MLYRLVYKNGELATPLGVSRERFWWLIHILLAFAQGFLLLTWFEFRLESGYSKKPLRETLQDNLPSRDAASSGREISLKEVLVLDLFSDDRTMRLSLN